MAATVLDRRVKGFRASRARRGCLHRLAGAASSGVLDPALDTTLEMNASKTLSQASKRHTCNHCSEPAHIDVRKVTDEPLFPSPSRRNRRCDVDDTFDTQAHISTSR